MSRIRRLRTELGFIYSPAVINDAMDAMADDVAALATADAFDPEVSQHAWIVLSGLRVVSDGGFDIEIDRGVAIARILGVGQATLVFRSGMDGQGTLSPPDLTNPRVDLVCLVVTDTAQAYSIQGRVGGVPDSVATQNGPSVVFTIVKGVAGPSPVAPALPVGALLLAHCRVETDGTVNIIDRRPFACGVVNRPASEPFNFVGDTTATGKIELLNVVGRPVKANAGGGIDPWKSGLKWDRMTDLPAVVRGKNINGETIGEHGLMLIPGGREYWRTFPVIGAPGSHNSAVSSSKVFAITKPDYLEITPNDQAGADTLTIGFPLPVDIRGIELIQAQVIYQVMTPPTNVDFSFEVQHRAWDSGTWDSVFSNSIPSPLTGGSVLSLGLTAYDPLMVKGWLRLLITAVKSATAGALLTSVRVYGVRLKFREGRA